MPGLGARRDAVAFAVERPTGFKIVEGRIWQNERSRGGTSRARVAAQRIFRDPVLNPIAPAACHSSGPSPP